MSFRFSRRVKIFPGVHVNLGKRGTSVSLGGKGYSVNFSKNGTRTTVGVPGTGLSYSEMTRRKNKIQATKSSKSYSSEQDASGVIVWMLILLSLTLLINGLFK